MVASRAAAAARANAVADIPYFCARDSKLTVPPAPPTAVPRNALCMRLRAERGLPVVAVVAAAGYGKTTLLAQWVAKEPRPCAWLTVDTHDNDPVVLLGHVATALAAIGVGDATLVDAVTRRIPVWNAALGLVTAAMAHASKPFVLILDDADHIRRGDSADILIALLDSVPAESMLVLAGRTRPPVGIPRLRATGRLLELGTNELALSAREARVLVRGLGADPDDAELARRCADAEGWAAGLCLVARAHAQPSGLATDDAGTYLADYFATELLLQLPDETLAFLRRVAVLAHFSAPLCDAVLGTTDAADMLDALEHQNLFVAALDGPREWWRLHPYLRDVLLRELMRREPDHVAELNRRASAWFLAHGELELALPYAQAGHDDAAVAEIIGREGLAMYDRGHGVDLAGAIDRFGRDCGPDADAAVAAVGAFAYAMGGRRYDSLRWLAAADAAPARAMPDGASSPRPWLAVLHAIVGVDGTEETRRELEAALRALPVDSAWRPLAHLLLGAAHVLAGDDGSAQRALALAEDAASALTRALALAARALLAFDASDTACGTRLAQEARAALLASATSDYPVAGLVHAAAARGLLCRGRWDDARVEIEAAEALIDALADGVPWLALQARLALAGAYATLRDRTAAKRELAEAEAMHARHGGALLGLTRRLERLQSDVAALPEPVSGHGSGLTWAELRVLPLLATHLSFREIGLRLFVSRNTVKTQAISIYRKLGVSSRSAAIERAVEIGLTAPALAPQSAGRGVIRETSSATTVTR